MRILVAGATSVPGLPLVRELTDRGHDVVGLTRQSAKTPEIERAGAEPVVADVFDARQIEAVVAGIGPEVVVSLLTTLPKRGPLRSRTSSRHAPYGAAGRRIWWRPPNVRACAAWSRSR